MNNIGEFQGGKHGSQHSFFIRLSRYGNLGWVLFLITLAILFVTWLVIALAPPSVMVVDKQGNFLGHVSFANNIAKTDEELIGAVTKFGMCYWSFNSSTIQHDQACALQMMDTEPFSGVDYVKSPMRERRFNTLRTSNYIAKVEDAKNRSVVNFDDITILDTRSLPQLDANSQPVIGEDGKPLVRVYKRIVISGTVSVLGTDEKVGKFKQELYVRPVPRTSFDHVGVLISDINDI